MNTREVQTTLLLFCSSLLLSCDCPVSYEGFVLDATTEKPIEHARIKFANRKYTTDSLGFFEISYIAGFCPEARFVIEKENYDRLDLTLEDEENQVVYKLREVRYQRNSIRFKIKNDTMYFYLPEKNWR